MGEWWVTKQGTSGQAVGCMGKELHQWVGKQGNRQKGRLFVNSLHLDHQEI